MNKTIEKEAKEFQQIAREIKKLQDKQKPLKNKLIDFAKENKANFDEAYQLKFKNGTYVSLRVKDELSATSLNKDNLLAEVDIDFVTSKLNESKILAEASANAAVRKLLTKYDVKVSQKETYAIYAG